MPILKRTLAPPPGILAGRRHAHPALLRMLSRARRRSAPLLLVRVLPAAPARIPPDGNGDAGGDVAGFLAELASVLRINDLAWREPDGSVLLLLEDAPGEPAPVLARLEQCASRHGLRPRWRSARFPEQGLTLQALLEAVQWAA